MYIAPRLLRVRHLVRNVARVPSGWVSIIIIIYRIILAAGQLDRVYAFMRLTYIYSGFYERAVLHD